MTTFSGALAVIMGGYVAGTGAWAYVAVACVVVILVSSAANAWNDLLDVEIDMINRPDRPLPSGQVSVRAAKIYSFSLAALSLIIASLINPVALAITLAANILLYIYSWKLKSTVLLGNVIIAAVSAASAVMGGVAAGNARPSIWLASIIFVGILGREVLKTLADYEGDLYNRCRTIATVWGRRPARIVFYLLVGATLLIMMLPYLLRVYRPIYAYIVAFGVYPVVFYVVLRVTRYRSGAQLEKLSQLMKYDFMVWFAAVILGAVV